jgi:hypothetical protein
MISDCILTIFHLLYFLQFISIYLFKFLLVSKLDWYLGQFGQLKYLIEKSNFKINSDFQFFFKSFNLVCQNNNHFLNRKLIDFNSSNHLLLHPIFRLHVFSFQFILFRQFLNDYLNMTVLSFINFKNLNFF